MLFFPKSEAPGWHDFDLVALAPGFLDRRPVLGGEWLQVELRLSVSYTLDIG